jgi:hypothetical protein
MLVSMGFTESNVISALQQYPNIDRATEYLLATVSEA